MGRTWQAYSFTISFTTGQRFSWLMMQRTDDESAHSSPGSSSYSAFASSGAATWCRHAHTAQMLTCSGVVPIWLDHSESKSPLYFDVRYCWHVQWHKNCTLFQIPMTVMLMLVSLLDTWQAQWQWPTDLWPTCGQWEWKFEAKRAVSLCKWHDSGISSAQDDGSLLMLLSKVSADATYWLNMLRVAWCRWRW